MTTVAQLTQLKIDAATGVTTATTLANAALAAQAAARQVQSDITALVADVPPPPPPPPPSSAKIRFGGFGTGWGDRASVSGFLRAIGVLTDAEGIYQEFNQQAAWTGGGSPEAQIAGMQLSLGAWQGTRVWSMPFQVTASPQTFTDITSGSLDASVWIPLGKAIGAQGDVVRMGWEFNDGWPVWSVGYPKVISPATFIAAWQHIVTVIRSVAPTTRFVWNPDCGLAGYNTNIEAFYPGDGFVDVVALDMYVGGWNSWPGDAQYWANVTAAPPSPQWAAAFALAHKKTLAIMEWGIIPPAASGSEGPGDDTGAVQDVLDWAKAAVLAGTPVWLMAWGQGTWNLIGKPQATATIAAFVKANPGLIA